MIQWFKRLFFTDVEDTMVEKRKKEEEARAEPKVIPISRLLKKDEGKVVKTIPLRNDRPKTSTRKGQYVDNNPSSNFDNNFLNTMIAVEMLDNNEHIDLVDTMAASQVFENGFGGGGFSGSGAGGSFDVESKDTPSTQSYDTPSYEPAETSYESPSNDYSSSSDDYSSSSSDDSYNSDY